MTRDGECARAEPPRAPGSKRECGGPTPSPSSFSARWQEPNETGTGSRRSIAAPEEAERGAAGVGPRVQSRDTPRARENRGGRRPPRPPSGAPRQGPIRTPRLCLSSRQRRDRPSPPDTPSAFCLISRRNVGKRRAERPGPRGRRAPPTEDSGPCLGFSGVYLGIGIARSSCPGRRLPQARPRPRSWLPEGRPRGLPRRRPLPASGPHVAAAAASAGSSWGTAGRACRPASARSRTSPAAPGPGCRP